MATASEDPSGDRDASGVRGVPREAGYSLSQEQIIAIAFNDFLDFGIDRLVRLGLPETDALEAVFGVATVLEQQEALPPFPEEDGDDLGRAAWLVAAVDLDFFDVVVEALQEG